MSLDTTAHYVIVGALGAALGASELLSRYKDKPSILFGTTAVWFYMAINAVASMSALLLIERFGWEFGVSGAQKIVTVQILVAGLGAAALFRSSLFMAKIGDDTVGVGPNIILMSLLNAADRAIDRNQAETRLEVVGETMKGFDFSKHDDLVTECLAAAANVSPEDVLSLKDSVESLSTSKASDAGKSLILGLLIIDVVGANVMKKAVKNLDP